MSISTQFPMTGQPTIQHSSLRLLAMLGSGILFSVASLSTNASTLISSAEYLDYELPKSVQDTCGEKQRCPEIEVKYLNTNLKWINDITNKRIDSLVVNSQPSESAVNKKSSSAKDVKIAIDNFAKSQFAGTPEGSSWAYTLTATPDYLGHVETFELFQINSYVFTGGAHGMPYSEYLIFDPSTKKQVKLVDMLQADKNSRFKALAYEAYKTWVKTVDENVSNYEKNWPFTLSDNVTLTDKGIDIRYQHYDIGPYAYGMPVLSIPYSKLNGVIKPHFMPKIK
ncbi:RsiV family protein [Psychrobacter sp. CAL346-MNA-CIBAN-0220]|uniref:RsiV family protein n=1 Tax=Psychrobacter sp. CAL346-MNA-CIBAN-0220 TaxID=3140457 RepID=UPI00332AA398